MEIGWCPRCNVPVRGKKCNICGSEPHQIKFHDLGDIRPASEYEKKILISKIPFKEVKNYVRNRIVLLSRQPGLDYRKDVFIDGFRFGTLEYVKNGRWRWRFYPSGKGAALMYHLTGHICFDIDSSKHLKGKKLKREIDGEWDIMSSGNCIGVVIRTGDGVKIKDIYCKPVRHRKRASMKDAVRANMGYLRYMEKKGVKIIEKNRATMAAFSGGKDSEVSLYMATLAGVSKAVFVNTGMEFPETERFVYNFADFLGVELVELHPDSDFWDLIKNNGIPTKDHRWCTAALKINTLKKLSGTMVDGMRKYESERRMHAPQTRRIGNLKVIYPIFDALALDVWLYIMWKGLPYNPLYDMGYERLGCYMCPSMLNAEFHNLKKTHPELFKKWSRYLKSCGFSNEDILDGLWRWKTPPPKIRELIADRNRKI